MGRQLRHAARGRQWQLWLRHAVQQPSGVTDSNQYSYTHLDKLWQEPYNGSGSYQYLYCNTSQPHQLTGLYPSGTICSTTVGQMQTYAASYDAWAT